MPINVKIDGALTGRTGQSTVSGSGGTFGELLDDLDRQYPGFHTDVYSPSKEQIRDSIVVDAGGKQIRSLNEPMLDEDDVNISVIIASG